MKEYKLSKQCKGTRILVGNSNRVLLNKIIDILIAEKFSEIRLPTIEPSSIYIDKSGKEIENQMYVFKDKADRDLCLRPECTATIQEFAKEHKPILCNKKLFYIQKCYRYESPQKGRYREFYQLGVEILYPTKDYTDYLIELGERIVSLVTSDYEINNDVIRGLDYYTEKGFEISTNSLGTQNQLLGGGKYETGIGFAIGLDRLYLLI